LIALRCEVELAESAEDDLRGILAWYSAQQVPEVDASMVVAIARTSFDCVAGTSEVHAVAHLVKGVFIDAGIPSGEMQCDRNSPDLPGYFRAEKKSRSPVCVKKPHFEVESAGDLAWAESEVALRGRVYSRVYSFVVPGSRARTGMARAERQSLIGGS